MDLKAYYQKIRDEEARLTGRYPVVVSCRTQDGGKDGVCTEVPKAIAAKMIVEGAAREATPEEAAKFRKTQADATRMADEAAAVQQAQFKVVPLDDVRKLTGNGKA